MNFVLTLVIIGEAVLLLLVLFNPQVLEYAQQPLQQLKTVVTTVLPFAPSMPPVQVGQVSSTTYAQIVDSCGPYYDGTCVNIRSGPGAQFPVVFKARTGMILKVTAATTTAGQLWYKLSPGSDIRYPERVSSNWYVNANLVETFNDVGEQKLTAATVATTTKRIVVSISKQTLYAYDGNTLFMQTPISTGLTDTPTPHGVFTIFAKTPSRYMQGPIPGLSNQYYDLPGVPWDMYFTQDGAAIHGAYWHNHFGEQWSHGCINLPMEAAKELYSWAPLGTKVYVTN